jgi:ComF family protein
MIHSLKYKSDKKVGKFIGQQMGNFLNQKQVNRPDVIIPVPLHPKKQMKRGYNQAEILAEGIQEIINIPIDKGLLLRKEHSRSQTTKSKKERISSLEDVFSANKEKTEEYNHVLLVDDVITTGATLRACINALTRHKNIKISILVAGAGQ